MTATAITFSQWAASHGYSLGAIKPGTLNAGSSSINSLSGISAYDWTTTPTWLAFRGPTIT